MFFLIAKNRFTKKMFHDEDDDFSNLPVKPRGGGKVNLTSMIDDYDSSPVIRRGGGGVPVIPSDDPFDQVKLDSENKIPDEDPFNNVKLSTTKTNGFSLDHRGDDEFDDLSVKQHAKIIVPDEEKNSTVSNDNITQIEDTTDITTNDMTKEFGDLSVKACSPELPVDTIDYVSAETTSEFSESFDDLPVKPRGGKSVIIPNDDKPLHMQDVLSGKNSYTH